ncbi:lysophospholipase L1-like esterase [Saccharothrix tamanrassetensis]|uniref:Lysophospholipase L1-like esterase n=1 Tax=Saccharothrix tamanrassetensis TaxID=1051531 RepID=A0A841CCM8_9PSEU|nr:SGNH/GDSL hydrolase family protein [Saccharothrix tamanrassetensis]MBB5956282.1 lysophospholipase L1-like esterase [Saccharothrix tamanrassetensis]
MRWRRLIALTGVAVGGLAGVAYGLFTSQSRRARVVIGLPDGPPLRADGVYGRGAGEPLRFAVLGDSMAAGLGVDDPAELPGVLLANGLADETGRPVCLETHAVSGSTTRDLPAQVDRVVADPPDVALVIIGGNDVTTRMSVAASAALLGTQVHRLREAGIGVVVGTCPDLGSIRPIAQPLRSVAHEWSLRLARAQRREVERVGGVAVALGDLLAAEFTARHVDYFSRDRFHPSAAGYEAAASVLLAPLWAVVTSPDARS